jgi:hypothetical protein
MVLNTLLAQTYILVTKLGGQQTINKFLLKNFNRIQFWATAPVATSGGDINFVF